MSGLNALLQFTRRTSKTPESQAITEQLPAITDADRPKRSNSEEGPKAVQIPRIFWYACSYGVFVITTGIGYMAFNATTSSLEAFGAKLELGRVLEREAQVITVAEKLASQVSEPKISVLFPTAEIPKVIPKAEIPELDKIKGWRNQNVHQQQQQQGKP